MVLFFFLACDLNLQKLGAMQYVVISVGQSLSLCQTGNQNPNAWLVLCGRIKLNYSNYYVNVFFFCQYAEKTGINANKSVKTKFLYCYFFSDANQRMMHVNTVSLSPYPVNIPGDLTVSGSGILGKNLTGSYSLKVNIHKKTLGFIWAPIPCVANYGSW